MSDRPASEDGGWALRYAPHVGYLPPFVPLFRHLAGGAELDRQVEFIAGQGFAGVLHPWITSQFREASGQFATLLRAFGLEAGCVLYAGLDEIMKPAWTGCEEQNRQDLMAQIDAASAIAAEIGSRTIAVLVAANPHAPLSGQIANVRDNLRFAADVASRRSVTLGVEPMRALPNMLFDSTRQAADVLREIDHPGIQLIFDTAHVAEMDGDVLAAQAELGDLVCVYQLADAPGRMQPGSGTIDFADLLARLISEGYGGLVELEHGWTTEDADCERSGIVMLRDIEARAIESAASREID